MAFAEIECVNPVANLDAVPPAGVRVRSRALGGRHGGKVRYIEMTLGRALAAKLKLSGDKAGCRLLFGSDEDAGKIALNVDMTLGKFRARKLKNETWGLTINAATAEGLFSLDFPPFAVITPEVLAPAGLPPMLTFQASDAMLAVD